MGRQTITDILQSIDLEEREIQILQLRFGLGIVRESPPPQLPSRYSGIPTGINGHTLEEVGDMIGLSKERVRQIQHKALRKITALSRTNKLLDLLKEDPPSEYAAILIRAAYTDKNDLLSHRFNITGDDKDLTDFAKRVVALCFGEEAKESFGRPKGPGSLYQRAKPGENNP